MTDIFINFLNMSITASWLVLVLILIRTVFKKAPKWLNFFLYGLVGLRLVLPFSIDSVFSLIPNTKTININPNTFNHSSSNIIDNTVSGGINSSAIYGPSDFSSYSFTDLIMDALPVIWIIGIIAVVIYGLVSYMRVRSSVKASIKDGDGIYICDDISSPFILGLFRPKIYLCSGLNSEERKLVLEHEKMHIAHFDHIWKPLSFAILSVYWFNPLMWIAYIMLCNDIELACDERVIKNMDKKSVAVYSELLLSLNTNRKLISACPVAFGEVSVKQRVKSALSYKKPAIWIIVFALIISGIVTLCFMTNPEDDNQINYNDFVKDEAMESLISNYLVEEFKTLGYVGEYQVASVAIIATDEVETGYENETETEAYIICNTTGYSFIQGYFVNEIEYNDVAVAIIKNENGKDIVDRIKYPLSDEDRRESIKEIFPKSVRSTVLKVNKKIEEKLRINCNNQAKEYLKSIGRADTKLRDYSEIELVKYSDVGMSLDAANKIKGDARYFDYYEYIGTKEIIEDGKRYILDTSFDSDKNIIVLSKIDYDTNEVIKSETIYNDSAEDAFSESDLEKLKEEYPEYFGLDTKKGLTVAFWRMSETHNLYALYSGKVNTKSLEENILTINGIDCVKLRHILETYNIGPENIDIVPIKCMYSSYYWNIEEFENTNIIENEIRRELDILYEFTAEILSKANTEYTVKVIDGYFDKDKKFVISRQYTDFDIGDKVLVKCDGYTLLSDPGIVSNVFEITKLEK